MLTVQIEIFEGEKCFANLKKITIVLVLDAYPIKNMETQKILLKCTFCKIFFHDSFNHTCIVC